MRPLPRSFYDRDTILVARALLGQLLVHGDRIGRIVETEAYLGPHDRAAHSARGLTKRNAPMFGPPGHAYVYFIYGMYYCMNVVTERAGHAAAVLIRAVEPVQHVTGKTTGPGLLCNALGITGQLTGHDLCQPELFIAAGPPAEFRIIRRARIGVAYAGHWARRRLRFYIAGNPYISRP